MFSSCILHPIKCILIPLPSMYHVSNSMYLFCIPCLHCLDRLPSLMFCILVVSCFPYLFILCTFSLTCIKLLNPTMFSTCILKPILYYCILGVPCIFVFFSLTCITLLNPTMFATCILKLILYKCILGIRCIFVCFLYTVTCILYMYVFI